MDERISSAIGLTEEEVDVLLDLFQRAGSMVAPRHVDTARALFPRLRRLKFQLQDMKHPERKVRNIGVEFQFGNADAPPTQPEGSSGTD
jgi:hypothetical protein